jgi:conjugative relaxase-like TrwC/TraI family protein
VARPGRWVVGVMRVTTIKAPGGRLDAVLAYYVGLAEDRAPVGGGRGPVDYYLDPDEPPGQWRGLGRHALGLEGPVAGEDLRALLEGHHPHIGERLGRRFGESSTRGFDATFSAPKSVSVLWALTPDPWVRAEVLAAHDAAVDAALDWFERQGGVTRRGRDGILQVDTRGVTAAVFRQHTSRTVDPQLHSHAVISAKVQDETGNWLALDARFLKYQQRTIGWIYDAALRAEMTNRLGVDWVKRDGAVFDLACVPEQVRDALSERSAQVDAKFAELVRRWAADHDGADPEPRTLARLQRAAAVASRPGKVSGFDPAELHAHWTTEAQAAGFNPERLTADRIAEDSRTAGVSDEGVIGEALQLVAEESATWLRADLARHLATILPPGTADDASRLVAEIDRLAAIAEQRCLAASPERDSAIRRRRDGRPALEHVTDRRLTLPTVLAEEQRLQDWAATATSPVAPTGDPQLAAAEAIAGSARLVIVVGPAGTGKTHTTARAVETLQSQGRPVVGLAPSGKAADVLALEARCPTDTLAGFLTRHRSSTSPWPAGTTVILDEAGMAATADLARLVDLVEENRWRLVVVGDPEQLPAVGRGGVFAHWCDTLPHHTLDAPRRFTEPWEAAASLGLRAGHPDAVAAYADHGRLHSTHPATLPGQIAQTHRHHTDAGRTITITTTNADTARAINREIQWHTHPRASGGVTLHDGTSAHVGDQIATRRNDRHLVTDRGQQVRNRHTWAVTSTRPDGSLTVTHPDRGTAALPAAYVRDNVELGWAVTGYGNQGDTVDIGIAVLDAGTSRNHAYVAMTRGRHANHALVVDPTGTIDRAERLAEIIARPTTAESALATQARLHRQAGNEPPTAHAPASTQSQPHQEPSASPAIDPELERQRQAMQRRLDQLQQRPASRGPDRSLGL